jgi:hypothetical protein
MRKVTFTEEQMRRILGEAADDFILNLGDSGEIPGNAYGTEVFTNNIDPDANDDVTTADNFSRKRSRTNRLFARTRTYESVNESTFDDNRGLNFGKNEKDAIVSQSASDNAGKMLKNISKDINNGGTRNNTNQVRLSRLQAQKKSDPVAYAKNGGDNTVKALKNATRKVSSTNTAVKTAFDNSPINQTPDANKGAGKGHHENNEASIYYY